MSAFRYNGIPWSFVDTEFVDQEAARDQSDTELLHVKSTLSISGVISYVSPGLGGPLPPSQAGERPAGTRPGGRLVFPPPRRPLRYATDPTGPPLFDIDQVNAFDVNNGPKPVRCTVRQLTSETYLVTFVVEVHTAECVASGSTNPIASLRWSQSCLIDDLHLTTRRTNGRLVIRSDANTLAGAISADSFRGYATPPLLAGARRTQADYTLSEDGLTLTFAFTDREENLMPPDGAVRWDDPEFTLMTSMGEGKSALTFGAVGMTLWGRKGTSRGDLILIGVKLCMTKLRRSGVAVTDKGVVAVTDAQIKESQKDCRISVLLRAVMKTPTDRQSGLMLAGQWFDTDLPGVAGDTPSPDPGERGTALLSAVALAFQDPCLQKSITLSTRPGGDTPTDTDDTPSASVTLKGGLPPEDNSALVDDTDQKGTWTSYLVDIDYTENAGTVVMPVTVQGSPGVAVAFANPDVKVRVSWTAGRFGSKPKPPQKDSQQSNLVYEEGAISQPQLSLAADGETLLYSLSGSYLYGVLDASKLRTQWAVPPWMDNSVDDDDQNALHAGDYGDPAVDYSPGDGLFSPGQSPGQGGFSPGDLSGNP